LSRKRETEEQFKRLAGTKPRARVMVGEREDLQVQGQLMAFGTVERDLSHLLSDAASLNLSRENILKRLTTIRNTIREEMRLKGYKGYF